MPRWDRENVAFKPVTYDNAPCHSCVYRDREDFGPWKGGSNATCDKYPVGRYAMFVQGKPLAILEGKQKCEFYKEDEG